MSEWVMIGLMGAGALCWPIGGTGFLPVRRFLWPGLAAILLVFGHVPLLTAAVVGLTILVTCILPYGDRTPWPVKWLVFTSYGLPVCWLDWQFGLWWTLGCGIVLTGLMLLSHRYNRVTHKVWEFTAGALQAIGIVLGALC